MMLQFVALSFVPVVPICTAVDSCCPLGPVATITRR